MPSTKVKSITRRIARLEALSPSPQPKHWRGGRWRSRAPFHPSIHMRFGNLRRLPEDSRLQISCLSAGEKEKVKITEAYDLARATLPPKNRSHHAPAMAENTGIRCRVPKGAPRCVLAGQRTPAAEFRRSCLDHAEDYGRSQRAGLVPPVRRGSRVGLCTARHGNRRHRSPGVGPGAVGGFVEVLGKVLTDRGCPNHTL
jgi:hypothetical protein